jgi:hypothetical protein
MLSDRPETRPGTALRAPVAVLVLELRSLATLGEQLTPDFLTQRVRRFVLAPEIGKRGRVISSGTRWRP